MWKILQRNRKWVHRCTISESLNTETGQCRFSATIAGWRNWRLLVVDQSSPEVVSQVIDKAREILRRIDENDDSVFGQHQAW